ncbi:hypothetical protein [Haloarcula nitratireducens]|uniref:Uncharacterized protein n=1 Tax=Haloarcula nitratireducens TaxID=2487749 RepID=A0AAW4PK21_9EURY|nr:hypothetical protein [Halomicroarcula nitratireducens]MBX0297715.1 hypothetical protein [Halomicroarcula nitratireducens]
MTDSPLSAFSSDSTDLTPNAESVARCATITPAPDCQGVSWSTPDSDWGLTTRRPYSSIHTSGGRAHQQQTRWVVDGDVGAYVRQSGTGEVRSIPNTYGEFSSVETDVTFVDGLGAQYGYGFDGSVIEKALRVLTGGGRYSASKYSLTPCGRQPWVLTGPEGTLLCSCAPVDRPTEGRLTTEVETDTSTIAIEEQNQRVLDGVHQFIWLIEDSVGGRITSVEYQRTRGETQHVFVDDEADEQWAISAGDLAQLASLTTDPSSIQGSVGRGIQPPRGGETIVAEWDGPGHPVGYLEDGDIIAGYEFHWETPAGALEDVATVRTYRLTQSYGTWTVEYRTDRIATVVP